MPNPDAAAIGELTARLPGAPVGACAKAQGCGGGEEGGQQRVLRPGAPDGFEAGPALVGDPEEDGVRGGRPAGLIPAGAPVAGALGELASVFAAAVDLDDQAHDAEARRWGVVRAEILWGVGVGPRALCGQPVEVVANRGEAVATGVATAEGSDHPAHAADAQVGADVFMQCDAKPVGEQQPWVYARGDRAHGREAWEACLAQQARSVAPELVAAPARDGDGLDGLIRLPAPQAFGTGLTAHGFGPDQRTEIVFVEQDAVVQALEQQPAAFAELRPGDAAAGASALRRRRALARRGRAWDDGGGRIYGGPCRLAGGPGTAGGVTAGPAGERDESRGRRPRSGWAMLRSSVG